MTNEDQIRRLIENWAAAVRCRDIDKVLMHHADDMIMFDVPLPFQSIGIGAYKDTWNLFFNCTKPDVFDIDDLKIFAGDEVAFCIATMHCEDSTGGNGFERLDFRLTVGLKKIGDQWIIVHEHHSVPAE